GTVQLPDRPAVGKGRAAKERPAGASSANDEQSLPARRAHLTRPDPPISHQPRRSGWKHSSGKVAHWPGSRRFWQKRGCQTLRPHRRMPMAAPQVERPPVPRVADERTLLEAWLDYHRATPRVQGGGLRG